MSKRKHGKDAPLNFPLFPDIQFPSDRLTLAQLRAYWPDPEDLAKTVKAAVLIEYNIALNIWDLAHGSPFDRRNDPLFQPEFGEQIRDLSRFYVHTGLATGRHAAELLIRDIEEQTKKLADQRLR